MGVGILYTAEHPALALVDPGTYATSTLR
ncbi:hypothetical protein [Spirosoma agri]